MIKLIEYYKNYRKAKARFDIALDDLYEQYKSMVVFVSVEECVENITVSKMFFERWLPKDSGEPNHREKFVAAFEGCCDGCPNSFEMTKYRLLALFVEAAEEKREDAKKRLMSHFWRQKNVQK